MRVSLHFISLLLKNGHSKLECYAILEWNALLGKNTLAYWKENKVLLTELKENERESTVNRALDGSIYPR
jgi:hypothetical protein